MRQHCRYQPETLPKWVAVELAIDILNNLVPSRPATRMSSSIPPGWNLRYGVILYTLPLKTDQASSGVLCWLRQHIAHCRILCCWVIYAHLFLLSQGHTRMRRLNSPSSAHPALSSAETSPSPSPSDPCHSVSTSPNPAPSTPVRAPLCPSLPWALAGLAIIAWACLRPHHHHCSHRRDARPGPQA